MLGKAGVQAGPITALEESGMYLKAGPERQRVAAGGVEPGGRDNAAPARCHGVCPQVLFFYPWINLGRQRTHPLAPPMHPHRKRKRY